MTLCGVVSSYASPLDNEQSPNASVSDICPKMPLVSMVRKFLPRSL